MRFRVSVANENDKFLGPPGEDRIIHTAEIATPEANLVIWD